MSTSNVQLPSFSGLVMVSMAIATLSCASPDSRDDTNNEEEMPSRPIDEVLADHTDEWMELRGVVGTSIGQCDGAPCIRVLVVKKTDQLAAKIPAEVEGYTVELVETGRIEARDSG